MARSRQVSLPCDESVNNLNTSGKTAIKLPTNEALDVLTFPTTCPTGSFRATPLFEALATLIVALVRSGLGGGESIKKGLTRTSLSVGDETPYADQADRRGAPTKGLPERSGRWDTGAIPKGRDPVSRFVRLSVVEDGRACCVPFKAGCVIPASRLKLATAPDAMTFSVLPVYGLAGCEALLRVISP